MSLPTKIAFIIVILSILCHFTTSSPSTKLHHSKKSKKCYGDDCAKDSRETKRDDEKAKSRFLPWKAKRIFRKSRQDKRFVKSEDMSLRSMIPSCPPGLWCKRGLTSDEAERLGYETSRTISACPLYIWCKRASNDGNLGDVSSRSTTPCPPGLWCKRGLTSDEAEKLSYKNSRSLPGCPVGMWCKKRSTNERNLGDVSSRSTTPCPPGLWCKRGITRSIAAMLGFQRSDSIKECPAGVWCKRKSGCLGTWDDRACKKVKKSSDSLITDCPPGLWCKRSPSEQIPENSEASSTNCPPGLWCKRAADIPLDELKAARFAHKRAQPSCPPGLWCKRDTRFSAACPAPCKRHAKKYDMISKRLHR